jgi:hypothetical protein
MNKDIEDRLIRETLRALDGKLGGSYPRMLAGRIMFLSKIPDTAFGHAVRKDEQAWLGPALLNLAQKDTKTLRLVADALDSMRKDGQAKNEKRYSWLNAYLWAYEELHCSRPPTMKEVVAQIKMPDNEVKRAYKERAGRKLFTECNLPITNVQTGRPKGAKDTIWPRSGKSERRENLRSLLLRE